MLNPNNSPHKIINLNDGQNRKETEEAAKENRKIREEQWLSGAQSDPELKADLEKCQRLEIPLSQIYAWVEVQRKSLKDLLKSQEDVMRPFTKEELDAHKRRRRGRRARPLQQKPVPNREPETQVNEYFPLAILDGKHMPIVLSGPIKTREEACLLGIFDKQQYQKMTNADRCCPNFISAYDDGYYAIHDAPNALKQRYGF